jgi:N-acetylglutamate synthase-like GNAT family acetyltransferase
MSSSAGATEAIQIEQLQEADLAEADHIFRLAFGTFLGLPDPLTFAGGSDYIRTRWTANPSAFFGARLEGKLVGTNFASNWGSVGFFGPLTIHPDYWDRGVGKRLVEAVVSKFSEWQVTQAGLYTFAQSQKHVGLYQKFGFWPRFLTAIMSRPVSAAAATRELQTFSELNPEQREQALASCRSLTNEIYPGLDLSREIQAIASQNLGDTILLSDPAGLVGIAICHCSAGSEAGPGVCYVKFGAVGSGPDAAANFESLLAGCETLAARRGLSQVFAGVNTARIEAYRQMIERGFKTAMQGVAMHAPNEAGYSRPRVYALDDWR